MGDIVETRLRDRHQHGVYTLWIGVGIRTPTTPKRATTRRRVACRYLLTEVPPRGRSPKHR